MGVELAVDERRWEPSVECSVPLGSGARIAGSATTAVERGQVALSWVDQLAATVTLSARW
jgi:hypothetical protein